ncbi:cytochrome P450, partial [Macrophomina phaseolina]
PQPPGHEFIFGHAKLVGALAQKLPPRLHPQTYGLILQQKYGLSKAFYVDLWPFSPPWLIVTDPVLADQVSVKPSLPKFGQLKAILRPYIGVNNLVVQEGHEWKRWRTLFNPAFSAGALQQYMPALVDICRSFCDTLSNYARSGECFQLEPLAVNLTVEIIGHIILGSSFATSPDGKGYAITLRDQVHWVAAGSDPGFAQLKNLNPWRAFKMRLNERSMDRAIKAVVLDRWTRIRDQSASASASAAAAAGTASIEKPKHAIDLALSSYANDMPAAATLDERFLRVLVDQMKTFIFAGHDTSSGTLCYAYWLLARHPRWLSAVRHELSAVLGPDAAARIAAQPALLNDLTIVAAVVKETLRLFPPASSVRTGTTTAPPIVDPETGATYPTDGFMVMNATFSLHRDPAYFPDPHAFRPERWMRSGRGGAREAEHGGAALPEPERTHQHAWRAFEVGPRNCIGQELAVMEIKLILALTLGRFDIAPSYDAKREGGDEDGGGQFEYLGAPAYPVLLGTAKPNGGMPVRVVERLAL